MTDREFTDSETRHLLFGWVAPSLLGIRIDLSCAAKQIGSNRWFTECALAPTAEYVQPLSERPRSKIGEINLGAYDSVRGSRRDRNEGILKRRLRALACCPRITKAH